MAGDAIDEINGDYDAADARFALVLSRFNEAIGERLLSGALDVLHRHGVSADRLTVVRVPGAFEIPWALRTLAAAGGYDALVALGAVIRGATPHFDYVAGECAAGVRQVSLEFGIPVGFGVLTVDTVEQAIERSGTKGGNKGADAAMTALELASLARKLAR